MNDGNPTTVNSLEKFWCFGKVHGSLREEFRR